MIHYEISAYYCIQFLEILDVTKKSDSIDEILQVYYICWK